MIAVVGLPRLATEVLRLPEEQARAVVVDEGKVPFVLRSVSVIVDATEAARALGVRPGMRVLDAQRYAPSVKIDVVTQGHLQAELHVVAEVLLACSPIVQPLMPSAWTGMPMAAVALDLFGMVRPVERILVDVRRACARLRHRALAVASPGTRLSQALVRAGHEGVIHDVDLALAALPVQALELSSDLASSLFAIGARTAADLKALLPKGGVERLGDEARAVLDTITAQRTPLRGIAAPARVIEAEDLDHPVIALEALSFLLNRLCHRLCLRARARRQRLAEVTLTLRTHRNRAPPYVLTVAFPAPIVDDKAVLRSLVVRLERAQLKEPVDHIALEATRVAARGPQQLGFFHERYGRDGRHGHDGRDGAEVRAEEALHGLLAEMSTELGAGHVGCLVITDEPLPERMTRLAWPAPPPPERSPAPERRRPRKTEPLEDNAVTRGGRFLAAWPWPLRLLPRPVRLAWDARESRRELLGILEGEDRCDAPYERTYELLVLKDGRRALVIYDDELEDTWVCGWFD